MSEWPGEEITDDQWPGTVVEATSPQPTQQSTVTGEKSAATRSFYGLPATAPQFAPTPERVGPDPNEITPPSFPDFLFQPKIEVPRMEHTPDESVLAKYLKAIGNVGGEFVSGASSPMMLAAPLPAIAASLPEMATGQFQRVQEAEKTEAGSPERIEAGLSTVGLLGGLAAGARSGLKPKAGPKIAEPKLTTQEAAKADVPLAPSDNPAMARFQEEVSAAPIPEALADNVKTTGRKSLAVEEIPSATTIEANSVSTPLSEIARNTLSQEVARLDESQQLRAQQADRKSSAQAPDIAEGPKVSNELASESPLQDNRISPETSQADLTPTGTKNAITNAERESRGIAPAEEAARRDFGTVWDEAAEVARQDVEAPRRLVAELKDNARALTDKENALLLRRQIEVQAEHDAAIKAVNDAPGDAAAQSRLETARNELQTVYDAAKSAGTESGRGLNARKMLANQDFTLAKMEAETRAVANAGRPLSPKQTAEVKTLWERINKAEAKVAAYEARAEFGKSLQTARRTRLREFTPVSFLEEQAARARERITARRGRLYADPIGVTQIAHLVDESIIGASYIAKGVRNFSEWSKTMIAEFGEKISPYLKALFAKAQAMHSEAAKVSRLSPDQRLQNALAGDKKRIATNIEKIQAKTDAGDFEPAPKKPPRMDREKAQLIFEYQKAKEAYTKGLFQAKLAKQSLPRKAVRYGGEVLNTARALMTSFDLSAVLRQGGFVTLGHPLRALKSFPAMFQAFASEKAQFRINAEILERPNSPLYRQSKLYLADDSAMSLSKMEEAYMSRWANKIPIVAGSQRAYTTFLNKLRADSFDAMMEGLSRRGKPSIEEAKAIANFVNVSTGRGNMGGAAQAAVALNTVFFAPRYVVSRFQMLAGQPMYGGTLRTRFAVAKEYARFLGGLAVVYALGKSAGAEVESDPRSSDFGKIRFGDTRLDPLSGLSQSTVILSRLGSGETKNLKGKMIPIRGEKVPYGSSNSADVLARFLRTKLSPAFGGAVDTLAGKNVVGQPVTPASTAKQMMVPLSFGDIYNAMQEQGIEKGSALAVLALFGMGVQNYAPEPKPKSERRQTLSEAMRARRLKQIEQSLQR